MKKLLLLGGSAQQVVAIETAKRLGFDTVLCDYLPDNPGQFVADKFYQTSTTDKEAILAVARQEQVDGVIAYASDPAAPTAAYVAGVLGLPTNPYTSVQILCNKDLFRQFLRENGFNTPASIGCHSEQEVAEAIATLPLPLIVKPVDSSGSKGVTVIRDRAQAQEAARYAFSFTRCNRVIVEQFLEKKHPYLIGGDIFVYQGKVIQWGLMNCHRDSQVNPLVPVGKSYPCQLEAEDLERVKATLQGLVDKLHILVGPMNVELIVDKENRVWPIDIGPRSGGNMIPDLLGHIFRTNVVEMSVRAAMGMELTVSDWPPVPCFATHNLHSAHNGLFEAVEISEELRPYVIRTCIYKKPGDRVEYFDNAAKALGILFFQFPDEDTMRHYLNFVNDHIHIRLTTEEHP